MSCKILRTCSYSTGASSFVKRKVEVLTGQHLFSKKEQDKRLKFQMTYVDEGSSEQPKPVVVLLPGTPGSYKDFTSQINFLTSKGARVVAPNFPDLHEIRQQTPTFRNNPVNRAALLTDFLKTIGINSVDVLASHSSGFFAALRMFVGHQQNLNIRSMAFLNPTCMRINTANPAWIYKILTEMIYWKLGYKFYELCGMWLLPRILVVDVPRIEDPLVGMSAVRCYRDKDLVRDLEELGSQKKPLLFVFSGNDIIIPKSSAHEVLAMLGSTNEDFWSYDKAGKLTQKGNTDKWVQTMYFEKGSHFIFKKFPEEVNWALLGLLQRTIKLHEDPSCNEEPLQTKPVLQRST